MTRSRGAPEAAVAAAAARHADGERVPRAEAVRPDAGGCGCASGSSLVHSMPCLRAPCNDDRSRAAAPRYADWN